MNYLCPIAEKSDFSQKIRWTRSLIDLRAVDSLKKGLVTVTGTDNPLSLKSRSAAAAMSLVSVASFDRAIFRTKGNFDRDVFAKYFLDETDGSPLYTADAYPDHIGFLKATNERTGSRVALFLHTSIENEQHIAHDLFKEQGLADRPFLPGAHISIGTIPEQIPEKQQAEIADYLFSLVSDELVFHPVTQEYLSPEGYTTMRTSLTPVDPCRVTLPEALAFVA